MGKLKSAKELLREMGFNNEAPESTQFAFLRHLKKQMTDNPFVPESALPEQLEFDLDDHSPRSCSDVSKVKKVSNR